MQSVLKNSLKKSILTNADALEEYLVASQARTDAKMNGIICRIRATKEN